MTTFVPQIVRFLKKRHYKAVKPLAALIDMDGTLYDSMRNHSAAWYRMITELGIDATQEEFYMYEGRTGASTINIIFQRAYSRDATPEEIEELYHRKTVYFSELPPVKLMPGAPEMVRVLMESGIKRVLVTGSGQTSLINRINEDFPNAFSSELRVTSRDVSHGKPHPEPFIRAMQLAGVKPSQSIAIENAPLGVKSASDAGAFTIAVTTGPIPQEAMVEAGAAVVFSSMEECAENIHLLIYELLTTSLKS